MRPRYANYIPLFFLAFSCGGGDPDQPEVTYAADIAPLMAQHCQGCHQPGGVGPFSLLTYNDVVNRAASVKEAVVSRYMPHGVSMRMDTGCALPSTFEGPRELTQREIDLVAKWVDLGTPFGDTNQLPSVPELPPGEWLMGDPDFETPNNADGFTLPANLDRDVFRRFVVAPEFDGDRFITGFEALPDTPAAGNGLAHVVHHVTLFVNPGGEAFAQEQAFAASDPQVPGPGFEGDFDGYSALLVGMWFPGSEPLLLREGLGVRVPEGAALVFEVHYSPTDTAIVDRTRIGIRIATEVTEELGVGLVRNIEFMVPADDPAYIVQAERVLEAPLTLHSITPHQHQLGTDFRVELDLPGGESRCLADVAWDFEHQATYRLKTPLQLGAGTRIRTTCTYDNSIDNPNQIHFPPQDIPFGAVADHEMCQLTIASTSAAAPPPPPPPAAGHPELVEVLYNAVGEDPGAEWIKLRNPGDQAIDLGQYSFGWGGDDYTYGTLDLSGTLGPGECVIVGAVPDGLDGLEASLSPALQNGGAVADGLALFLGPAASISATSVPVDAVIYAGAENSNQLLDSSGEPGSVNVGDTPAGDTIRRVDNAWSIGEPQPAACP
jgi:hypothetical protein